MRPGRALRLLVPLVILAVLWQVADGPQVLARLRQADGAWLLAALAAAHLQILLSALRWQAVARALGQGLALRRAVAEYYLAQLVNQTLPGGVIGDAARAVRGRDGAGLAIAAQAVVIERAAGQVALLAVTSAGFAVALALPGGVVLPAPGLGLAGGAFAVGALALCLPRHWQGVAIPARLALWLPRLWQGVAAPVRRALLARAVWPRQVALGLAIVACNLASFALAARATGTALSPEAIVTLIPLILTAMLIPLSVAGWGFREGAAVALLPLAGVGPEAALAASLAFGAVILVASLPGIIVLVRRKG